MQASALPKPERVNQVWLDDAMDAHEAYLRAIPGGQRLFVSFKDGRYLDFTGRNLASVEMVARRWNWRTRAVHPASARDRLRSG